MAFSTARHDNRADDPDESRVLKSTVRFVGQRVAAVVADSVAIAEKACRAIAVEHQELPAGFHPEVAHTPAPRHRSRWRRHLHAVCWHR